MSDLPDWVLESAFSRPYSPGGLGGKGRRRELARRAGLASGRKRRQLAKGRPRPRERTRELALGKLYPKVRQVAAPEFECLYRRMCERQGLPVDRRGLNTAYALYRVEFAAYRAQGQEYETTNGQRQQALGAWGRGRSRRTVQYTRKRLEAMGLVCYEHVKRGTYVRGRGWCAGDRADTLRVRLLRANCTPPTGAGTALQAGFLLAGPKANCTPPATNLSPPDKPADDEPPDKPAEQPTDAEREEREREYERRFAEYCASSRWHTEPIPTVLWARRGDHRRW